jgi:hypothetical protein
MLNIGGSGARAAVAACCAALGAAPAVGAPSREWAKTTVGPGPVSAIVARGGHTLSVTIRPNRAAAWNTIALAIGNSGTALHGEQVTLSFSMPSMAMGRQTFALREGAPGVYTYLGPAIVMPGRWNLILRAVPSHGPAFTALIADRVL